MYVSAGDSNLAVGKCRITRNGELELLLASVSYPLESLAVQTILFCRLVGDRVKVKEAVIQWFGHSSGMLEKQRCVPAPQA